MRCVACVRRLCWTAAWPSVKWPAPAALPSCHRSTVRSSAGRARPRRLTALAADAEAPAQVAQPLRQVAELLTIVTQGFGITEVLFSDLLHAGQVLADLRADGRLLVGGGGNQLVHLSDRTDVLRHGAEQIGSGLAVLYATAHAVAALLHGFGGLTAALLQAADDLLNFSGGQGGLLRQVTHLVGDHSKATALITGAGSFDRGVEGQQVGLFGNRTDHFQYLTDLFRLVGQRLHFTFGDVDLSSQLADLAAYVIDRTAAFGGLLIGRLRGTGSTIGMPPPPPQRAAPFFPCFGPFGH